MPPRQARGQPLHPIYPLSLVFLLVCWFGLRQAWGFLVTLVIASAIWLAVVLLPRWLDGWLR